jgi:RNA polymerase sigma factor (sigma-70 family)
VSKRSQDTRGISGAVSPESPSAAVAQLVEANLRLVVSYAQRFHGSGLDLVDLIHAGNLGLIEAARRFDAARDASFIGYASWWVRQAMIHALADRSGAHPMPASAVATPAAGLVPFALSALLDGPGPFEDGVDGDFDETFEEIQSRANGTPRHADRLRSHLN